MSRYFTFSKGISGAPELVALLGSPINKITLFRRHYNSPFSSDDIFIGWGNKANTKKIIKLAKDKNRPFWHLEDGFISYLGHPALGDRRFSLIVDKSGIYYDATRPSDIETLLNSPGWITPEIQVRSANLLKIIRKYRVSKYNHEPFNGNCWQEKPGYSSQKSAAVKRVLVVDQTYGDCSVKYGLADESCFRKMLDAALSENPDSEVWVKVHPDVVLGKKKGYFELEPCGRKIKGFNNPRLKVLADKVNAQSLFPYINKVYVVTSQLGFEALWHRKKVVCFGVPFYSGWGLTDDRIPCPRRKQMHTLESLFAAACLKYTRYIDPETGERCELEDVLELIALQRQYQQQEVNTLYAVGFSLWKRGFLTEFIGGSAKKVCFVQSPEKAKARTKEGDGILIWGAKHPEFAVPEGIQLWRGEDAFIRSVGLGAELRRPGSLVLDKQSMYFDCTQTSDLETAISSIKLHEEQVSRGFNLRQLLAEQRVSKYNLTGRQQAIFSDAQAGQKKILVTGQVDSDASLRWGSPEVTSNFELLKKVRSYAPQAYIVYKPHPDVLMAGRAGHIPEAEALKFVDRVVSDGDIFDCIHQCDELHVMTSLAGFEALVCNKTVHCWGMPFYAGWGLTVDHMPCDRRKVKRSLDELVYFAHCHYPRYINWNTRRFTTPERMIRQLKSEKAEHQHSKNKLVNWFARNKRKVRYLLEALQK